MVDGTFQSMQEVTNIFQNKQTLACMRVYVHACVSVCVCVCVCVCVALINKLFGNRCGFFCVSWDPTELRRLN